jgi:thiamine biosynthesis protein ThiI
MEINRVLVRYGDIGTKSEPVRSNMVSVLRQRIQDRLEYEELEFEKVKHQNARIIVLTEDYKAVARAVSEIPGVASCSPAVVTGPDLDSIKSASRIFEVGETFGVEANRSGQHDFDTRDICIELGSFTEEKTGSSVDLDNPDTWLEVDLREDEAYVFTRRYEGPDGLPVGSSGSLAALVSGGIDSPVAAHEIMTRGCDIMPVYFYNKPIAAEDHLLRLVSVLKKLERFHPSKKWHFYVVDMEEINQELMKIERGRMLIHRKIMFKISEMIVQKEGLSGLVTGEAIGQKSSQTPSNLELTSSAIEKPVFRPLVSSEKSSIVKRARQINTFEEASIDSACSTMAPESPATSIRPEELAKIEQSIKIEDLVKKAFESAEKRQL